MVQYYRDMWARRSEMMAPLTDLVGECRETKTTRMNKTKKKPWRWDPIHQQAFGKIKAAIAKETVLAYPDFLKPFEIYMEASSTQLVAVITQDNRPVTFFSRKLSEMQQKYSVTEIKLLAIVETLKEFKGMLQGQDIKVYTDHKNLTRDALGLTSDRVYRWRLLLEEYAPVIIYVKGIHNTVADTILRLEYDPKLNTTNEYTHTMLGAEPEELSVQRWKSFAHHRRSYNKASTPTQAHCFHMNEVFVDCSDEDKIYPLTTADIAAGHWADASLKHLFKRNAVIDQRLEFKLIENTACVCKDGQLVIPKPLQVCAFKWYHNYLQHPGHTCLEETMITVMYWKGMRTTIWSLTKSCKSCQVNTRRSQKYGHLSPKTVYTISWVCLCVDLIGPYTLNSLTAIRVPEGTKNSRPVGFLR
jgi:hypothetical protein